MIAVHPDSEIECFIWEPESFDIALSQLDPDIDAEKQIQQVTYNGEFYLSSVLYYAPYGHSLDTAAASTRNHLLRRLDLAMMNKARQLELQDVVVEIIAEETLRYLAVQIEQRNLPIIPENHVDRLRKATYDVARTRSLGELYFLAWKSAAAAADAAQRNPRATKSKMTVHAVNRFEQHAQQALNPSYPLRRFSVNVDELAALTRTLFLQVLSSDPATSSLSTISWPVPASAQNSDLYELYYCTQCRNPISTDEAMLWLQTDDAFLDAVSQASEQEINATFIGEKLDDSHAEWKIGHAGCMLEPKVFDSEPLPSTYQEFLLWAAETIQYSIMGKNADLGRLLYEAATQTGRFTRAQQPKDR